MTEVIHWCSRCKRDLPPDRFIPSHRKLTKRTSGWCMECRRVAARERTAAVLTLVARGAPLGEGLAGVKAFVELAHEWIVRGFADLTTPEMHSVWQRDDLKDTTPGRPT